MPIGSLPFHHRSSGHPSRERPPAASTAQPAAGFAHPEGEGLSSTEGDTGLRFGKVRRDKPPSLYDFRQRIIQLNNVFNAFSQAPSSANYRNMQEAFRELLDMSAFYQKRIGNRTPMSGARGFLFDYNHIDLWERRQDVNRTLQFHMSQPDRFPPAMAQTLMDHILDQRLYEHLDRSILDAVERQL